ncbi:uncharacterized protein BYT42DRAFT_504575 [Radiomyces spectabilis]|uniref:uncharacterized protein n=1 Tax=Radiomyces spectabilis TaxID=64574 RepID=UPI00221F0AA4|nr:uncharacterized protein BYT42DRAFT_504575 [Radiomyces spectabilis]KAI8367547.1 hypothetical protein BYT42DRAFT_504575 [Radiomyces spectabilis]
METFERTTAGWKDICSTTIANLILEELLCRVKNERELFDTKNADLMEKWHPEQYYFNKKEIIPYVDKHWKSICTERARTTTWWATLGSCLYSSKDTFIARDERQRSAASDFCLVDANLWHIRPSTGKAPTAVPRAPREKRKSDMDVPPSSASSSRPPSRSDVKWRAITPTTPSPRSSSPILNPHTIPAVFPSSGGTADHPFNRFGFKYKPCEPSILPLVAYQQAENILGGCTLSPTDKSSYVSVTQDGLTVTTEKGFRMCRANVGVKEGNWYWEAIVQNAKGKAGSDGPHVRIGWARREACLNAPVGYDAYGYGYRDMTGDKLFCSRPEPFGEPFETGDVIGLYISLPRKSQKPFKSPTRRRIPIAYKDNLWFEEKDFRQSKELEALADPYQKKEDVDAYEPQTLPGSYIAVYKNGVYLGVMFKDLIDYEDFGRLPEMVMARRNKKRRKHKRDNNGTQRMRMEEDEFDGVRHQQWTEDPPLEDDGTLGYYPAVSVFKGGMVTCNFGPDFQYPPTQSEPWKPMSQRYSEYMAEECVWDLVDEVSKSFRRSERI